MSIDLNPGDIVARTAPAAEQQKPRYVGRHRWDRGGPTDEHGRRLTREQVDAGYRLTPAAEQLATRTEQPIPAGPNDATGLLDAVPVQLTNEWTQPAPADRGQVLVEMRDQLADPAAAVADIFTAAGCTTPPTDASPEDPA